MTARGGTWYGSSWIRPERRLAIYHRDGFKCVWCEAEGPLCLDHLWRPMAGKYDNRSSSLVTSCMTCNNRRTGRRLARWLRVLRAEGIDACPVVGRLRAQVGRKIDKQAGRTLASDPKIRRARRAAGGLFVRMGLHLEAPCPF